MRCFLLVTPRRLLFSISLMASMLEPDQVLSLSRFRLPAQISGRAVTLISLRDALIQLKTQYNVNILFEDRLVSEWVDASIIQRSATLEQNLTRILQPHELHFRKVRDGVYVIRRIKKNKDRSALQLGSRENMEALVNAPGSGEMLNTVVVNSTLEKVGTLAERVIEGTVKDEKGEYLPGVTIIIKDTQLGTTTNADGKFTANVVDANAILVVSYVGYLSQEILVRNRTRIDITLEVDQKTLDEVVVVGYGVQKKTDITGSVASVSGKDIRKIPTSRLDQALQGQIPGLQISTTSGAPGGNASILVRGIGSVTGGVEPLIVVDGFAGISNLNAINTGDIESIEVLKDASATAIYGSRGSNGVILVTTKRGKDGPSEITFESYVGIQQPAKLLKLMNARQFAEYVIEARNNGWLENGGPNAKITDPNSVRAVSYRIPDAWKDLDNLPPYDTDWQDVIFNSAPMYNYQLSANGGNDKWRYSLSAGFFDQKGILINSSFKRYTTRLNAEGNISKRLKVGMNMAPSYSNTNNVPSTGHFTSNAISVAWSMPPMIPLYNADGSYGNSFDLINQGAGTFQNPLKYLKEPKNKNAQFFLQSNAFIEYQILSGLKFRSTVGAVFTHSKSSYFKPSTFDPNLPKSPAQANSNSSDGFNWLSENTMSYTRSLNKHFVDVVGGFTSQKSTATSNSITAINFADDLVPNVSGGQINGGGYSIDEWSLLSYLARINYAYNDRYLFTATIRADGSSRFGSNNRWGKFPSFSVGWRMSEEEFMKKLNVFNDFKLRMSYGLSGNNDIGNYRYIGLLSEAYYVVGNSQVPALSQNSFTNNNLGWETSKQFDVGLDFSLFNNKLLFTGDYYNRRNTDMLLNKAIPSVTGHTSAWVNIGELENKGVELALTGRFFTTGKFRWTSNFNISFNRNTVLRLGSDNERIFADGGRGNNSITEVGYPVGSFYGHAFDGIFLKEEDIRSHAVQNGAQLGDMRFRDVDGNGMIDDNDRDIIGNPQPKFHYGLNNSISYKNWSLDILVSGFQGNDVLWGGGVFVNGFHGAQNNLLSAYENRWQSKEKPGDGKSPRFIRGGRNNNQRFSSFFIFDGSYLRVRNLTLNFTLPGDVAKKLLVKNARLYMSVNNLYTFSKYPGYDPEISNAGDNVSAAGVDYAGYPPARAITLGVSITF